MNGLVAGPIWQKRSAVFIFMEWMQALRPRMMAAYDNFPERKRRYYALVNSDILLLIKNGRLAEARACIEEITGIPLFSVETASKQ